MASDATAAEQPVDDPEGLGAFPSPARRTLGMLVVLIGVLITAIDGTIVVLALPTIEHDLNAALSSVIWVVIGYLLIITVLAAQVGRLGDMFGRVRMYEAGFAVFILGSLLCAVAWDEPSIIGFRILQGLGAAFVTANSFAVIADLYPPKERGRAYGFNAVSWSLGAVLGILLGGVIITYVSWRWIFWINVPIGGVALALAVRVLSDRGERVRRRLDPFGMLTLGIGLFGVLWAMTRLASVPPDATLVGFLVGGVLMLVAFVAIELRRDDPMLDLSLFRIPAMAPLLLAALFQGIAGFAVLFLVIMYLQGARGMSPIAASLLLVPGYVVGSAVGPLAGRLADRVGPLAPAVGGLAVQALSLVLFAQLTPNTALWLVLMANVVNMVGASCFYPANSSAVMKASPPETRGIASGVLRTFSNIGMVFSFTTAILVASHSVSRSTAFAIFVGTSSLNRPLAAAFTEGLHAAFYTMVGCTALAAVCSAFRGRAATAGGE